MNSKTRKRKKMRPNLMRINLNKRAKREGLLKLNQLKEKNQKMVNPLN